jgi:tetratricopeptide (TPR) repeat protein
VLTAVLTRYRRPITLALVLFVLLVFLRSTTLAQHEHAELTEQQVGAVHFPISCDAHVQKTFERGVALLHSFAFETAESVFRQVAQDDPRCAMAHWGLAATVSRWGGPDDKQLKSGAQEIKIAKSLHAKTDRERRYINAKAQEYSHPEKKNFPRGEKYLKSMASLYRHYPDDHEAGAFYALALEFSDPSDDPTHARRKQAAAILERLFVLEPNHPGIAHYLIHTYDTPGMAELGLPAARRYAQIAPAAPHALHMPSHIFARLGMWQEDIDSNLASIAASRNAAVTHMGDEGHQYHAMEFLVYAYLQSGREIEAKQAIDGLKDLPRMHNMYGTDFNPNLSAQVEYSASYVSELHAWKDAEDLPLLTDNGDGDSSLTFKARAIGAARLGHLKIAETNLQAIVNLHQTLVEKKNMRAANAEGKNDEALKLLEEIARHDSGLFATDGDIPAHEMMADILLEMHKPDEALAQYEAELKVSPRRFNSLYGAGRALEMSGQTAKASGYYQILRDDCAGGTSSRPELAHAREFLASAASTNTVTPSQK